MLDRLTYINDMSRARKETGQAAAPSRAIDGHSEDTVIRRILEGTAPETGAEFFNILVKNLALVLDTAGAWVTEYVPDHHRLRSKAF